MRVLLALLVLLAPLALASADLEEVTLPSGSHVAWRVLLPERGNVSIALDGAVDAYASWTPRGGSLGFASSWAGAGVGAGPGAKVSSPLHVDWGGWNTTYDAGEHVFVVASGADTPGLATYRIRIPADATVLGRTKGEARLVHAQDFQGDSLVVNALLVDHRRMRNATLEAPIEHALYLAFHGSADVSERLDLALDGPAGRDDGRLRCGWTECYDDIRVKGGAPGDYALRVVEAEGRASVPLFAIIADVRAP